MNNTRIFKIEISGDKVSHEVTLNLENVNSPEMMVAAHGIIKLVSQREGVTFEDLINELLEANKFLNVDYSE